MNSYLLLEDGTIFKGKARGSVRDTIGEVVFNTSMTGYQEMLTDPTYAGQMVVSTFPLIGNYGINEIDGESDKAHVKGIILRHISDEPNNFRCTKTLDDFLVKNGICALTGVDTRALTMILREKGSMNGAIVIGEPDEIRIKEELQKIKGYDIGDPIKDITVKDIKVYGNEDSEFNVVLYDYGYKRSILNFLTGKNCRVTIVPADTDADAVLAMNPNGIILSNGPGDPKRQQDIISNLKKIAESNIPLFGIGLGHQLVALAMGGDTQRLKYGHRGANYPVKDLKNDKTYITAQNHGYAVIASSISKETGEITHVNLNDSTVEGIRYHKYPVFTTQFIPDSSGGTSYLFDNFINLMKGGR